MDKNPQKPGFISRNIVAIVMIPGLVLMHWGWIKLQDTAAAQKGFTPEQNREGRKLPIVKYYERIQKAILEKLSN